MTRTVVILAVWAPSLARVANACKRGWRAVFEAGGDIISCSNSPSIDALVSLHDLVVVLPSHLI